MQSLKTKNSDMLEQYLETEKLLRKIAKNYWKDRQLSMATMDTLNSTMERIRYYQDEIKNGNP